MRRSDIFVGLLSLAVISWGGGYAYSRESFHEQDLHEIYNTINRESFDGTLPPAEVRWAYLEERYGEAEVHKSSATISIDKTLVTDQARLVETIQHESCHVCVGTLDVQQEDHGEAWQGCMTRFKF